MQPMKIFKNIRKISNRKSTVITSLIVLQDSSRYELNNFRLRKINNWAATKTKTSRSPAQNVYVQEKYDETHV